MLIFCTRSFILRSTGMWYEVRRTHVQIIPRSYIRGWCGLAGAATTVYHLTPYRYAYCLQTIHAGLLLCRSGGAEIHACQHIIHFRRVSYTSKYEYCTSKCHIIPHFQVSYLVLLRNTCSRAAEASEICNTAGMSNVLIGGTSRCATGQMTVMISYIRVAKHQSELQMSKCATSK